MLNDTLNLEINNVPTPSHLFFLAAAGEFAQNSPSLRNKHSARHERPSRKSTFPHFSCQDIEGLSEKAGCFCERLCRYVSRPNHCIYQLINTGPSNASRQQSGDSGNLDQVAPSVHTKHRQVEATLELSEDKKAGQAAKVWQSPSFKLIINCDVRAVCTTAEASPSKASV